MISEPVESLVIAVLAAAGLTYLALKVRQDRDRLRRIVGIIDAEHSFDMDYLCKLVEGGQLSAYVPPSEAVAATSRRRS